MQPPLPACTVPVPAFAEPAIYSERLRVGAPRDRMRHTRRNLLVATGTAVGLYRRRAGYRTNHPVAVWPCFDLPGGIRPCPDGLTASTPRAHGVRSRPRPFNDRHPHTSHATHPNCQPKNTKARWHRCPRGTPRGSAVAQRTRPSRLIADRITQCPVQILPAALPNLFPWVLFFPASCSSASCSSRRCALPGVLAFPASWPSPRPAEPLPPRLAGVLPASHPGVGVA